VLAKDGFLSREEVEAVPGFPGREMLSRKRVAVLECTQQIPCNPCESACPNGAITIGTPITNLPVIDPDRCTGCGLCVAKCPGLAIVVVDLTGADVDVVTMPYEYLPLPVEGNEVMCLDRRGHSIGSGRVLRVIRMKDSDQTAVITVEVPKGSGMEARNIRLLQGCAPEDSSYGLIGSGEHRCGRESDEDTIVCRCEEVTRREILDAIGEGLDSLDSVKRRTRAGMGLCQGRNCGRTIAGIIARETGKPMSAILPSSKRPPVRPVKLGILASGESGEEDAVES
jgi:Fe-S-cluster-containing hydrogenase component 2/bacterioferritin-associated ferredoxin